MTQKELADLLSVTDKAVSKWERGLNFPDLLTMEKIAQIFDTSVVELLGIEDYSNRQVASEITDLANSEKQTLLKIIRSRGWQTIIVGTFVYLNLIYFSKLLYDRHINGVPVLSVGVWISLIISNGIISVNYANRLLGKQSLLSKMWMNIKQTRLYKFTSCIFSKLWDIIGNLLYKSPINKIIDSFFTEN
jgi:transcriptional regulator with XRE-family HTH domain